MGHRALLRVGHVLELVRGRGIAESPDAVGGGSAVLVNRDAPVLADLDATGGGVESVTVGHTPGGDEEGLGGDGGGVVKRELHRVLVAACGRDGTADVGGETLGGECIEALVDVGVERAHERGAVHDGHLAAKRVKDVRELHGDEATAHDRERLRQLRQAHDVLVRVERHALGPLGDERTRADGQDDRVGADSLLCAPLPCHQCLRSHEPCVHVVHGHVRALVAASVCLAAGRDLVHAIPEDALLDGLPVGTAIFQIYVEPLGLAGLECCICGEDEHLRRNAADVEACAAKRALFHDGDLFVVEVRCEHAVAGAGADDDEVIVLGVLGVLGVLSVLGVLIGHAMTPLYTSMLSLGQLGFERRFGAA